MRIALHILGTEVFAITIGGDEVEVETDEPGDCTTYPVGFTPSSPIQRWEQGDELA